MTAARSDLVWVWPVVLLLSVAALAWGLTLLRRARESGPRRGRDHRRRSRDLARLRAERDGPGARG